MFTLTDFDNEVFGADATRIFYDEFQSQRYYSNTTVIAILHSNI